MKAIYTLNAEKNGIEIRFPEKPSLETLTALKAAGYRWSVKGRFWYARQTERALFVARQVTGADVPACAPSPVVPVAPSAPSWEDKQAAACANVSKAGAKAGKPSNVTPDGFRFMFNGYRTPAGELVKGSYSFTNSSGDATSIFSVCLYLDCYNHPEHPEGTKTTNNSDSMTDYFEHTKLEIPLESPAYLAALEGMRRSEEHEAARMEKLETRRNGGTPETQAQKLEKAILRRVRLFGENREQAAESVKKQQEAEDARARARKNILETCERLSCAYLYADTPETKSEAMRAMQEYKTASAAQVAREQAETLRSVQQSRIERLRAENPENIWEASGLVAAVQEQGGYSLTDRKRVTSYNLTIYDAETFRQLYAKHCNTCKEADEIFQRAVHQRQRQGQGLPATPGEHARAQLPGILQATKGAEACASAEKADEKATVHAFTKPLPLGSVFFAGKSDSVQDAAESLERQDQSSPYAAGESALVTHAVRMQPDALAYFLENLLENFAFLEDKGGTRIESESVNTWEDFVRLSPEDRAKLPRYALCVAVCDASGMPLLLVNPEGYGYARYTAFLPEDFRLDTFQDALLQAEAEACGESLPLSLPAQPGAPVDPVQHAPNFENQPEIQAHTNPPAPSRAMRDLLHLSSGTLAVIAREKGFPGNVSDYATLEDLHSRLIFSACSLPQDRFDNWRILLEAAWPIAFPVFVP